MLPGLMSGRSSAIVPSLIGCVPVWRRNRRMRGAYPQLSQGWRGRKRRVVAADCMARWLQLLWESIGFECQTDRPSMAGIEIQSGQIYWVQINGDRLKVRAVD